MTEPIDLQGLLDILGYQPDERVQVCRASPTRRFSAVVLPPAHLPPPVGDADEWFGVNPVTTVDEGRPGAQHVTRLAALWADLDVKPGGCPDFDTARTIVDDLSIALGVRPSAVTYSGHGLQPYWPIEHTPVTDTNRTDMRVLLRRWGRLVTAVADRQHSGADSVFDLPRILRMPGSNNHKDQPIPVVCLSDTGAPVTIDATGEALDAYGITELPGDRDDPGAIVSAPDEWCWAANTCSYARKAIDGWAADSPTARHPWFLGQATRLAAMHRNGCLTDQAHTDAAGQLVVRFRALLGTGQIREPQPGEINDGLNWGVATAASKSPEALAAELGRHVHLEQPMDAPPVPAATPQLEPRPRSKEHLTLIDGTAALAEPDDDTLGKSMRYSEDGHALMLADRFAPLARYCPDRGLWLSWTGWRWRWEDSRGGTVRQLAKDIARDIPGGDKASTWKRRALSAAGVSGVLTQASSDPRLVVRIDDLDSDPWVLNTPGGIVDLRTGAIRPSRPEDLATRTTNIAPDFGDTPQLWIDFLTTTFGGDQALAAYVQRLAGLALIGEVREQILPFWFGTGANGKSTLLEALMWALRTGDDGYALAAPSEILMVRRHEGHPTELAQLQGARLVVCSELEDGQRLAEARVKLVTGRDMISARFLYGQPFTFTPSHTIVLAGNHKPQATVGGPALWRRIRCVPFAHTVPEADRDSALPDKLKAIAGHILAWAIRGVVDYLDGGIQQPHAVAAATKEYEDDQDTVGRFVAEQIHIGGPGRTPVKELRSQYEAWCDDVGAIAVSPKRLTQELARFGVQSERGHRGSREYVGVVLLSDDSEREDNEQVTEPDRYWQ